MDADGVTEDANAGSSASIGTTRRGIGPTYAGKMLRLGVRAESLKHSWSDFEESYSKQFEFFAAAYGLQNYDVQAELRGLRVLKERFAPYVQDIVVATRKFLPNRIPDRTATVDIRSHIHASLFPSGAAGDGGQKLSSTPAFDMVMEGANGVMLDCNVGTYPFCTSSEVLPSGICGSLGIDPRLVSAVLGVVKAYTTRVGGGPFKTELTHVDPTMSSFLQEEGAEVGVSTGRARRCGWLDTRVCCYAAAVVRPDCIMLTKLDVLDKLPQVKVCTGYRNAADGELTDPFYFPADLTELENMAPEYLTLPGWQSPTRECATWDAMPENAKKYVDVVEQLINIPVTLIGVGPDRKHILERPTKL